VFNLACNIPSMFDATSFYRAAGPLSRLKKSSRNFSVNLFENWNWATLGLCDALFLQRPYTKEHVTITEMAKDSRMKVWIDYDDLLFDVPTDNPTFFNYSKPECQAAVTNLLAMADVVTVSTHHLKRQLDKFAKNIIVLPNCLDEARIPLADPTQKRNNLITWRGSKTHQRDVMSYAEPIIKNSQLKKDSTWQFIGDNLWFVTEYMPHDRTFVSPAMDMMEYLRHLNATAGSLMMVPLHDSNFNRCKSNIAHLEAAYSGMVTLGPAWEEWSIPGVLTYTGLADFDKHLSDVLNQRVDVQKMNAEARAYINEHYNIAKWNETRKEVIAEIMGIKPAQLD